MQAASPRAFDISGILEPTDDFNHGMHGQR